MILGRVEELEGSYLAGWAIAIPDDHLCIIEVTNESGQIVGSGCADRSRSDLSVLERGRDDFAFRIAVRDLGASKSLFVHADGEQLPGSPFRLGAGIFDGQIVVEAGNLQGWVSERKAGFAPLTIQIFDQDDQIVAADECYTAGDESDPLFTGVRFCLPIPDRYFGRTGLEFRAVVAGQIFAQTKCNLRLLGNLDVPGPQRVSGWLLSLDAPQRRFDIEVWRDDQLVGKGRCNAPRVDLRDRYPLFWETGFDVPLSAIDNSTTEPSVMSLRLAGCRDDLCGGPFVVGGKAAIISAARRVTQRCHNSQLSLSDTERAVLQAAMAEYIGCVRREKDYLAVRHAGPRPESKMPRVTIVIAVYRDVEVTRACIESVLRDRDPETDVVAIVNDCSPDAGMVEMLYGFASERLVSSMTNESNLGFVQSVNRALDLCQGGDVIVLNSDTRIFNGGIAELCRVAHSAPDIGTVTAMSNNATIFSYPDPTAPVSELSDSSWSELAAVALRANSGVSIEVPTGHGFCMLIKRAVLDRIPRFNEAFGHGYGEENELCQRAADLGFRNVAAAGVLVEHCESVSFGDTRHALLATNLRKLEEMFPEYTPTVMAFEATDALRRARWALDAFRLNKAGESGTSFALVIETWLGFGTPRAIEDIETAIGYGGAVKLRLASTPAGNMELISKNPSVRAVFSPDESRTFFEFIATLPVDLVVIHHLLGYSSSFIKELTVYVQDHKAIYYAHDFFSFCPRVTMIDAAGGYCRRADTDRCALCVEIGGSHAASRLTHLGPVAHRELFASLLGCVQQVVVPSRDTAGHFAAVFPRIKLCVVPHPQVGITFPPSARLGDASQIVLLGAIGPHKGSARLLDLAKLARLTHPRFHFHVIGYTDIDDQLASMPNVTITGRYSIADLPARIAKTGGTLALFLHEWPETFLYTLTEAVAHGLVPVVPDIGAPAERVRDAGFGVVYPFPVDVRQVLSVLDGIQHGQISVETGGATPQNYREANAEHVTSLQQLAQSPLPPTSPAAARPSPARRRTAPHGG